MKDYELMRLFKAIEFLYKGIDITKISKEDYVKVVGASKNLIKGDNKSSFLCSIDDASKNFLNLYNPYIYRTGKEYFQVSEDKIKEDKLEINTAITFDILLNTVRLLKSICIDDYTDVDEEILDPEFRKKMSTIESTWEYNKILDCEIKNQLTIENTESEIKTMLALCQYPSDLGGIIYDYFKTQHEFVLKDFKDYEVVDNRIIIPMSPVDIYKLKQEFKKKKLKIDERISTFKAIVISKNPLDYFYCSYGNSFQSCFALNSDMGCWYGYLPNVLAPESFIVYGTNGDVMKTPIISGSKFHNPQMFWRAWGHADEDGSLIIDKRYSGDKSSEAILLNYCLNILSNKFKCHCDCHSNSNRPIRTLWDKGKGIYEIWNKYSLRFYSDSLIKNNDKKEVSFKYEGCRACTEVQYTAPWQEQYRNRFDYWAKTVTKVNELNPYLPAVVVDGVLFNNKYCPITNLSIDIKDKEHTYAKYFTTPVKKLAILTYIDGSVFTEYAHEECRTDKLYITTNNRNFARCWEGGCLYTNSYCSNSNGSSRISLKTLKELIKGEISRTVYDAILLKVVEYDKVTCQVFKNIKGK